MKQQQPYFSKTKRQWPSSCYTLSSLFLVMVIMLSCSNRDDGPDPEIIEPKAFNGHVSISTQQELNEFVAQNITQINGNLIIGHEAQENPAFNTELRDLSTLRWLSGVSGDLIIRGNHELENLQGLENLAQVGGKMVIGFNHKLDNIDALENLESIDGTLTLDFNLNLRSIEALDGLRGVRAFTLIQNPALTKVFEFDGDDFLEEVRIESNTSLSDLTGLGDVNIADLYLSANNSITDLSGFEAITELQSLTILSNASLVSLNGLVNLSRIHHSLRIEENPELINLDDMRRLDEGPVMLRVVKNEKLQSIDRFTMTPSLSNDFVSVIIDSNPELADIRPLRGLQKLDMLQIYNNDKLVSLAPLFTLQNVKHLNIIHNDALTSLEGLEQLSEVEILSVSGNLNLTSLEGLNNLNLVSKVLQIVDNQKLTDLCALQGLAGNQTAPEELSLDFNAFNPGLEDIRIGNCRN